MPAEKAASAEQPHRHHRRRRAQLPSRRMPTASSAPGGQRARSPRRWSSPRHCRAAGPRPAPVPRPRPAPAPEYPGWPSGRNSREAARAPGRWRSAPIGRLIQKIHRQPKLSVMKPPIGGADDEGKSGDAAEDAERPGALFPGKARRSGSPSPAASPARRRRPAADRAAISARRRWPTARRPPTPATNRAMPAANIRRRPKRSPSAAPVSSSTAKAQIVGVDRPLQRLDRGAEIAADGGKGRGDDQRIQRHHEGRQRGHAKHPVLSRYHRQFLHCRSRSLCGRVRAALHGQDERGEGRRMRPKNIFLRPNPFAGAERLQWRWRDRDSRRETRRRA